MCCMCFLLILNIQKKLMHRWLSSCFTEVNGVVSPVVSCLICSGFLIEGGAFFVKESLNVRPDLVGFCPREGLKHTFTPVEL